MKETEFSKKFLDELCINIRECWPDLVLDHACKDEKDVAKFLEEIGYSEIIFKIKKNMDPTSFKSLIQMAGWEPQPCFYCGLPTQEDIDKTLGK